MKEKNKKLVMFDFDGVLVDTLFINHQIYGEVNENLSLEEFKTFYHGNKFKAVRADGSPRIEHPQRLERYDFHTRELRVPEIFQAILRGLSQNNVLVIVSSTHASCIKKILERDGVDQYFSDILGVEVEKSKVKKIKTLLEKYEVNPNDAVYITDTLGDIHEASECAVSSVAVLWGYHDREMLEKGYPSVVIDDPCNIIEVIKQVLKF
jgi:HAD superfamily hydrolase (TIGR01509 family)